LRIWCLISCNKAGTVDQRRDCSGSISGGDRSNQRNDVVRRVVGHEMFRNLNSKLENLFVRRRNLSAWSHCEEMRLCPRFHREIISLWFSVADTSLRF